MAVGCIENANRVAPHPSGVALCFLWGADCILLRSASKISGIHTVFRAYYAYGEVVFSVAFLP